MKIERIKVYQVDLPLHEGSYQWSGGKSVSVFDDTVVRLETDVGITGHGEVCPLGPFYLPAYAGGVRAGIAELGPHLLDQDPTQLLVVNQLMDTALKGHPYVKSALDMACWDILGKVAGLPVCRLLGGASRRGFSALSGDFPAVAPRDGGKGGRLSGRGVPALSTQGWRRPPNRCRTD